MGLIEAELLTDSGSDTVVRLPPRRFPGVLIRATRCRSSVAEIVEACRLRRAYRTGGMIVCLPRC
ncbi:DUF6959 family protein [Streptomyces erythrochromogenes]|uniref:DUF6959 family protein n=1 Tax=Streptomyces erythrochromogenes TaxID=285574 RepID=UPI00381FE7DD